MRILIVARPHDLADRRYDGFASRHVDLVLHLSTAHDVALLLLGHGATPLSDRLENTTVAARMPVPERMSTRLRRVVTAATMAAGRLPTVTDRRIAEFLADSSFDVVVTIGPWLTHEVRAAFGPTPSVHLAEEDLSQMEEVAPQSIPARVLRLVEASLYALSPHQPSTVITISAPEASRARRRYPRSRVVVVPYFFPRDQASLRTESADEPGEFVFVPGVLAEWRNAEGLASFLEAMSHESEPLPVLLCSARGYHPALQPYLEEPWVAVWPGDRPLAECYDVARVVILPALRVTGTKTTLVEAWAAGRPVACSPAVSRASSSPSACAVASGGQALVAATRRLWNSPDERERLVGLGFDALCAHDRELGLRLFEREVTIAARQGR